MPDDLIPADRVIEVRFFFALPNAATREQIAEWVASELGWGGVEAGTPLFHHAIEVIDDDHVEVIDTGNRLITHRRPLGDGRVEIARRIVPDSLAKG